MKPQAIFHIPGLGIVFIHKRTGTFYQYEKRFEGFFSLAYGTKYENFYASEPDEFVSLRVEVDTRLPQTIPELPFDLDVPKRFLISSAQGLGPGSQLGTIFPYNRPGLQVPQFRNVNEADHDRIANYYKDLYKPTSLPSLPPAPTISAEFENKVSMEYLGESFTSETKFQSLELRSENPSSIRRENPMEISPKISQLKSTISESIDLPAITIKPLIKSSVPEEIKINIQPTYVLANVQIKENVPMEIPENLSTNLQQTQIQPTELISQITRESIFREAPLCYPNLMFR